MIILIQYILSTPFLVEKNTSSNKKIPTATYHHNECEIINVIFVNQSILCICEIINVRFSYKTMKLMYWNTIFFETGAMATVLGQGGPAKIWIL